MDRRKALSNRLFYATFGTVLLLACMLAGGSAEPVGVWVKTQDTYIMSCIDLQPSGSLNFVEWKVTKVNWDCLAKMVLLEYTGSSEPVLDPAATVSFITKDRSLPLTVNGEELEIAYKTLLEDKVFITYAPSYDRVEIGVGTEVWELQYYLLSFIGYCDNGTRYYSPFYNCTPDNTTSLINKTIYHFYNESSNLTYWKVNYTLGLGEYPILNDTPLQYWTELQEDAVLLHNFTAGLNNITIHTNLTGSSYYTGNSTSGLCASEPFNLTLLGWGNSTYTDRKPMYVKSLSNLTNTETLFNITYNANMLSNFSDLFFMGSDDLTPLTYWIEEYVPSLWAKVWVKGNWTNINSTDAYVYYGYPGTANLSNPWDTMSFYDDFEDGGYTDKWTVDYGTWTQSGGTLSGYKGGSGESGIRSISSLPADPHIIMGAENTGNQELKVLSGLGTPSSFFRNAFKSSGMDMYWYDGTWHSVASTGAYTFPAAAGYGILEVVEDSDNREMIINGTSVLSASDSHSNGAGKVGFATYTTNAITIYWIYAFPNASSGTQMTLGAEENREDYGSTNASFFLYWKTGKTPCSNYSDCHPAYYCPDPEGHILSYCEPDLVTVADLTVQNQYTPANITFQATYKYGGVSLDNATTRLEIFFSNGTLAANESCAYDNSSSSYKVTVYLDEGEYNATFYANWQPEYAPASDTEDFDVISSYLNITYPGRMEQLHSRRIYPRFYLVMSEFYTTASCRYHHNFKSTGYFTVVNNITYDSVPLDLINGLNSLTVECDLGDLIIYETLEFETSAVPDIYLLGINLNVHLFTQMGLYYLKEFVTLIGKPYSFFVFTVSVIILVGYLIVKSIKKVTKS